MVVMKVISEILDCTIRDGGYYTDWDFERKLIDEYLKKIELLPIDYIEIGYRSVEKKGYFGEYFYLPKETVDYIYKRSSKKISIMLNGKDCYDIDLENLLSNVSDQVSLVRIAIDNNKLDLGMAIAKKVKELGFKVSLNVMYISKISNGGTFFDNLDLIDGNIDYLYLVDSYGSIYPESLSQLIENIKEKTDITLGFHGHNNLELAFVNTLKAIECGVGIVDCTVLGMGRGAGNLNLELLLTYLKSLYQYNIDFNQLSELVEAFSDLQNKYKWGTNLAYMVSGSYSLPQKEVMDALDINRYSLSGIVNSVSVDKQDKFAIFKPAKIHQNCLIIGGGKTVEQHINTIVEYLSKNKDILIIHATSKYIELFKELTNSQFFAVAGEELLKIKNKDTILDIKNLIFSPSPREITFNADNSDKIFELEDIEFTHENWDSPLSISLQVALYVTAEKVEIIGFDGYQELNSKKELYLMHENQAIIDAFIKNHKEIISLTPTKYKNINQQSIYRRVF